MCINQAVTEEAAGATYVHYKLRQAGKQAGCQSLC